MYAQFDSTKPFPQQVIGWHGGDTPAKQAIQPENFLALSQAQWDSREDTLWTSGAILIPAPPPPPPTVEQLAAEADHKAQQDLKAAAKMDAIFTDIATDTIAQLVHKIEVQFPNPIFTNQQQKILKACLVAAALSLRSQ